MIIAAFIISIVALVLGIVLTVTSMHLAAKHNGLVIGVKDSFTEMAKVVASTTPQEASFGGMGNFLEMILGAKMKDRDVAKKIMEHHFMAQFNGEAISTIIDGKKINEYIGTDTYDQKDLNISKALRDIMALAITKGDLDPANDEDREVIRSIEKLPKDGHISDTL